MQRAVEIFAAVHFLVMGLSHVFQARTWAQFFIWLREQGRMGVFVHGFISLNFGAVIVAFHNHWSGLPLILTLVGWAYLLKATLCFLFPATQMHTLSRVSIERAWEMRLPGTLYIAFGTWLIYLLWRG